VPAHRLFLIVPALARLIQKERGGERVREGYFPSQPHRSIFVQVEDTRSTLVLEPEQPEGAEERADLPVAQGQALLPLAQGAVEYVRTRLVVGSREIHLRHFIVPGPLHLVAVPEAAEDLQPLPWFGPEVTSDPAVQHRRLALSGLPDTPEAELTNAALHSLIDALENKVTKWPRIGEPPASRAEEDVQPSRPPVPVADADADEDDHLDLEDAVLRELARSLKPRR
jgi:CYTH domain-containing protein